MLADRAAECVPDADLLVITGVTILNNTLPGLLEMAKPGAEILVTGPTASMLPDAFFVRGVTIERDQRGRFQLSLFRQIRRADGHPEEKLTGESYGNTMDTGSHPVYTGRGRSQPVLSEDCGASGSIFPAGFTCMRRWPRAG